ncbi:hypothetical protein J9303_15040 [Bacillaceae bacterium Marseille-Q3522]|nr:hypothetical protein [Bacillaceae bacterium Marseille-Q3522]
MNIQQYYHKTAASSLNGSLLALIPAVTLNIYIVLHTLPIYFTFLTIPFFIYSLTSYQIYRLHNRRAFHIDNSMISEKTATSLYQEQQLLIAFLPAPSLRLLLFSPDGTMAGEIKDQNQSLFRWLLPTAFDRIKKGKYGIYNEKGTLLASIIISKKELRIELTDGRKISVLEKEKQFRCVTYDVESNNRILHKSPMFADIRISDEKGTDYLQIKTGWMPLEWGKRFPNPNTPVLTFLLSLTDEEKAILFGILAKQYAYSDY